MCPKDADGMANIVDPDQRSSLICVYTVCLDLPVRKQDFDIYDANVLSEFSFLRCSIYCFFVFTKLFALLTTINTIFAFSFFPNFLVLDFLVQKIILDVDVCLCKCICAYLSGESSTLNRPSS